MDFAVITMRLSVELGVVPPIEVQEAHEVPSPRLPVPGNADFRMVRDGMGRIVLLSPGPGSLRMTLRIHVARNGRLGRWEGMASNMIYSVQMPARRYE